MLCNKSFSSFCTFGFAAYWIQMRRKMKCQHCQINKFVLFTFINYFIAFLFGIKSVFVKGKKSVRKIWNVFDRKSSNSKIYTSSCKLMRLKKNKLLVICEKAREQHRNHDQTQLFYDECCAPHLNKMFKWILADEQQANALLAN